MTIDERTASRRIETMTEAAKGAGLKLTPQRLAIFRELARRTDHPDAETLHRAVVPAMPTVSLDTVYRTLWALREAGALGTLGVRHGCARFDPNLERHHHFLCERCGRAVDFTSRTLDALPLPRAARAIGRILSARVEVRGVCAECEDAPEPVAENRDQNRNPSAARRPVAPGPGPARRRRKT